MSAEVIDVLRWPISTLRWLGMAPFTVNRRGMVVRSFKKLIYSGLILSAILVGGATLLYNVIVTEWEHRIGSALIQIAHAGHATIAAAVVIILLNGTSNVSRIGQFLQGLSTLDGHLLFPPQQTIRKEFLFCKIKILVSVFYIVFTNLYAMWSFRDHWFLDIPWFIGTVYTTMTIVVFTCFVKVLKHRVSLINNKLRSMSDRKPLVTVKPLPKIWSRKKFEIRKLSPKPSDIRRIREAFICLRSLSFTIIRIYDLPLTLCLSYVFCDIMWCLYFIIVWDSFIVSELLDTLMTSVLYIGLDVGLIVSLISASHMVDEMETMMFLVSCLSQMNLDASLIAEIELLRSALENGSISLVICGGTCSLDMRLLGSGVGGLTTYLVALMTLRK